MKRTVCGLLAVLVVTLLCAVPATGVLAASVDEVVDLDRLSDYETAVEFLHETDGWGSAYHDSS